MIYKKYTKRRAMSFVLTLALVVSLLTAFPTDISAASDIWKGVVGDKQGIDWELDPDTGVLKFTGHDPEDNSHNIPDYSATNRPPWYEPRAMVTKIVFDNIGAIGNYAFADFGNLIEIEIDNTDPPLPYTIKGPIIKSIGNYAFLNCAKLEAFKEGVPDYAFDDLTHVGNYAFSGCKSLKKLNFSKIDKMESIGANAFVDCEGLELSGPAILPENSVAYCFDSDGVLIKVDANSLPIEIIKAPFGLVGHYQILSTIKTINTEAFMRCIDLESVFIPAKVTEIGDRAFAVCSNLKFATFEGNTPTKFGANVFDKVDDNFTIIFYPGNPGATDWKWTAPTWNGYPAKVSDFYLTLDKNVVFVEEDETVEIHAIIEPASARHSVTWNVTPAAIVSSSRNSANGVVYVIKGGSPGNITFEVGVKDAALGKMSEATCEIVVVEKFIPATGIRLDKTQMTIDLNDKTPPRYILSAAIQPGDATDKNLIWSSSNASVAYPVPDPPPPLTLPDNQCEIIALKAGTTNITVSTEDGKWSATCVVTVKGTPPDVFVPVTNITLSETTLAAGDLRLDLNKASTVYPENATNKATAWKVIDDGGTGASVAGGILTAPVGKTGTVTIEATVNEGLAPRIPGPPIIDGVDYTKQFTVNVISFIPVTAITDVPDTAYVGVPLQLHGTVVPANASYKKIEWKLTEDKGTSLTGPYIDPATGAYIDPDTGVLSAQKPGRVSVTATIKNGAQNTDKEFIRTFNITIKAYAPNTLTIHANPGGRVSGAGQYAEGESVRIAATPDRGWVFAGWESTLGGGSLDDALSQVTQYTMPDKAATVVASFTYVGTAESGNDGWYYDEDDGRWYYDEDYNRYDYGAGVILPDVESYFTSGSTYSAGSATPFTFVIMKDYQLLRSVSLNGKVLVRNSHYIASRESSSYTQITLVNGYLNTLAQGAHTLTVNFADNRTVTAIFSVIQSGTQSWSYTDVISTAWYYDDVAFVSQRGWLTSNVIDSSRFRPSDPVTQGEVVDALYRMAGSPNIMSTYGYPLQGRDASHRWVLNRSILPLDGPYNLDSTISRQNIAFLLSQFADVRRLHYRNSRSAIDFADEALINPRALDAVTELYRAGIINGRANDTFDPLGHMTRAEFAAVLHRFADSTRL